MENYHSQNGFFHYKICLEQPEKNITQIGTYLEGNVQGKNTKF
jgi:hypothetical protein